MSDKYPAGAEADRDCVEFQKRLPLLFGTDSDFSREEHLENCANCAELVQDLEYIAQQAKLLMPIQDPSPVVWENIKSALGATGADRK